MPRAAAAEDDIAYRVKVVTPWGDKYYGTYRTKAAAKGQSTTLACRGYGRTPYETSIEWSHLEWKALDND